MRSQWSPLSVLVVVAACGDHNAVLVNDAALDATQVDGPVAPMSAPDLRFQWVGASNAFQQAQGINLIFEDGSGGMELSHTSPSEYSWSPLQFTVTDIVPANYSWEITDFAPPRAFETMVGVARTGPIASLANDLAPHLTGNEIVVSIDIFPEAYAFVTRGTKSGALGYHVTLIETPRAQLDLAVASEGAAGHVVTALSASPTAGMIRTYSFARDGDSKTYETRVLDATSSTLVAQARDLAAGGYIITAFGRVGDNAMVLIGTRTPGAGPRTISVQTPPNGIPDLSAGDAVVAWILDTHRWVVILQR